MFNLAGWQSGYAAACKAVNAGSIPASASTFKISTYLYCFMKIFTFNGQKNNYE